MQAAPLCKKLSNPSTHPEGSGTVKVGALHTVALLLFQARVLVLL